jgi:hypothetical protein
MKYTKIPSTTFQKLVMNAGVILTEFDPTTGTVVDTDILGATSGGSTFAATPEFIDFGEDIDNCPKNMMELKNLDKWDVTLSGTLITADADVIQMLISAADVSGNKITPRRTVKLDDFKDLWLVADYSEVHEDEGQTTKAGFIAIKILNVLNTGGFQLVTQDNGKAQFAFTFTGHVSMDAQDVVPFEVYVVDGVTP